jgi:hypothetical protein
MRNKAIIIFAIFSLFVFSFFTGCDDGSTSGSQDAALNGTWVRSDGQVWKFDNGNWENFNHPKKPGMKWKGTYTADGSNITMSVTHIWLGEDAPELKWYNRNELKALGMPDAELDLAFATEKGTYTVSNNGRTLIIYWNGTNGPDTFTKQ